MEDRSKYIGSSDARYILQGDFDKVYSEKMGLRDRPDLRDNFKVQLGVITEDFHLDWTTRKLNEEQGGSFQFSKDTDGKGSQHFASVVPTSAVSQPLLGSHPDALLKDHTGAVYPIEVKMTGRWANADETADFYMPQLQHHMLCWGAERILISVIVKTEEPERIWVGASLEWQQHYIEQCDKFWQHIVDEKRPAPQFFDAKQPKVVVPTQIADTVPRNGWKKRSLDGDNQAPELIEEYLSTKEYVKRHDKAKADLKALMRDDENELYGDALTLKRNSKGSILINIKKPEAA